MSLKYVKCLSIVKKEMESVTTFPIFGVFPQTCIVFLANHPFLVDRSIAFHHYLLMGQLNLKFWDFFLAYEKKNLLFLLIAFTALFSSFSCSLAKDCLIKLSMSYSSF